MRRGGSHLRLVHPRRPILTREQLANFETPKTWAEILQLEPRMTAKRWREAIMDADEHGFDLLTWTPGEKAKRVSPLAGARPPRPGTWSLTQKGRVYVARRER